MYTLVDKFFKSGQRGLAKMLCFFITNKQLIYFGKLNTIFITQKHTTKEHINGYLTAKRMQQKCRIGIYNKSIWR